MAALAPTLTSMLCALALSALALAVVALTEWRDRSRPARGAGVPARVSPRAPARRDRRTKD